MDRSEGMVEDEACLSTGGVYILSESKVAKNAKEKRRIEWAAIPYVFMRPFFISPIMRRRRRYRALPQFQKSRRKKRKKKRKSRACVTDQTIFKNTLFLIIEQLLIIILLKLYTSYFLVRIKRP